MKISKISVQCEVVRTINFQSTRCNLACDVDIENNMTSEQISQAYDKIYDDLHSKCENLVNKAMRQYIRE